MTVQESGRFGVFEETIGQEKSLRKTEFEEVSENIVCFHLGFCRILEKFDFFESSVLEYLDVILSNECFVLSFNLIAISSIAFNCFVMKEMAKKYFDSVSFGIMKDIIECNMFCCNFQERQQCKFPLVQMPVLCDWAFLLAMHRNIDSKVTTCDSAFVLNQNEIKECQFSSQSPTDKIGKEYSVPCEVLKLSGGSGCKSVSTFLRKKTNHCIEIDDSVQIINVSTFYDTDSLTEIIFSSKNGLKEIDGMEQCVSLCRIEIGSSVEVIGGCDFFECTSLSAIIFFIR
jgi:hypothetical protein